MDTPPEFFSFVIAVICKRYQASLWCLLLDLKWNPPMVVSVEVLWPMIKIATGTPHSRVRPKAYVMFSTYVRDLMATDFELRAD